MRRYVYMTSFSAREALSFKIWSVHFECYSCMVDYTTICPMWSKEQRRHEVLVRSNPVASHNLTSTSLQAVSQAGLFYSLWNVCRFFVSFCWPTRDHLWRSTRNSNPIMTLSAGGANKGCSDHRFRAPPAYTAQLLTLHRYRANNQYRTVNQI